MSATIKTARPINDRILVKQDEAPTKVESDVIDLEVSGAHAEKPNRGVVIAIGPGLPDKPMPVEVGDYIMFQKGMYQELELDGEPLLLMPAHHTLLILENKKDEAATD